MIRRAAASVLSASPSSRCVVASAQALLPDRSGRSVADSSLEFLSAAAGGVLNCSLIAPSYVQKKNMMPVGPFECLAGIGLSFPCIDR